MLDKLAGSPEDWGITPEQMELLRTSGERKLTAEEKEQLGDIKLGDTVVISEEALSRFAAAARAEHGENGGQAKREGEGPPPEAGARGAMPQGAGGPQGGAGPSAAASNDERVEELEREIEELEEEIMELQAKAASDEQAQAELRSKRTDLSLKEDELQLMQQQGQA